MDLTLGSFKVTSLTDVPKRINLLLWGPAGCGKTTLAASAPGKKLWILFDPNGLDSLQGTVEFDNIIVLDLSTANSNVVAQLASENVMGLEKFIAENQIDTVVLDSTTTYLDLCLKHGIIGINNASEMAPSMKGYGNRKYYLEKTIKNLVKVTDRLNKHLVLLAHENRPDTDENGCVVEIAPLLGGSSTTSLPIINGEVWNMYSDGKNRKIRIKQNQIRKPMKTRMFDDTNNEFVLNYDPYKGGNGIKEWFEAWLKAGKKIAPF